MAKRRAFHDTDLSPAHRALTEALRAGLTGNVRAAERLARRLVRDGLGDRSDEDTRKVLSDLLVEVAGLPSSRRRAQPATAPMDQESRLPLADVDEIPSAQQPIFDEEVTRQIGAILEERRHARELASAGIEPTKTLLLAGPPGSGKTMTAGFIARSLELPLVSVELAALMSSFLGRTGQNLRQLLDYGRETHCVILLDEFDALAKKRDDVSDVGELKRIVNVLLLELERWPATSLLIAATNHPHLLDPAIERRFDAVINLDEPATSERLAMLRRYLGSLSLRDVDDSVVVATAIATEGMTGAHLERLVRQAARASLVSDRDATTALADVAFERLRTSSDRRMKALFSHIAHTQFGLSRREIGRMLSVTHPTVTRLIAEARAEIKRELAA